MRKTLKHPDIFYEQLACKICKFIVFPAGDRSHRKRKYCKNQTYCGERVHAGRKHARHSQPQHAPLGRERPEGESRLPAAIVPPPGLGMIVCMRKFTGNLILGSMQEYFLQISALKNGFRPKRAKTKPRGCKITTRWP